MDKLTKGQEGLEVLIDIARNSNGSESFHKQLNNIYPIVREDMRPKPKPKPKPKKGRK